MWYSFARIWSNRSNKNMKLILPFFRNILEQIGSAPKVGGLQISDSGAQYILLSTEGKAFSLRFSPGVVREGRIIDAEAFSTTLKELYRMTEPERESNGVPVVVSLPAAMVFTQTFNLPNVGRDRLSESAQLTLQMLSPISPENAYMSWEEIAETEDKFEILGAFSEKIYIDEIRSLLEGVGFTPVAFEFPSLGLTRVITESIGDMPGSAIGLEISSDGLDLFIMRHKSLHFDYFRSWQSIQGDSREIAKNLFEDVVAQEVQRVTNFALSKFKEVVKDVYLIAPGFEEEMETLLGKKFGLRVITVKLSDWDLSSPWYSVLGSALRGREHRRKDRAITLAPFTAADLFFKEQSLNFIVLWRNVIAVTLFVFLLFYGSAALSLSKKSVRLEGETANFHVTAPQTEITKLAAYATEFNQLVSAASSVKGSVVPWDRFFSRLFSIAQATRVTVERLDATSLEAPFSIAIRAGDEVSVLRFKAALTGDAAFSEVGLDISKITTLEDKSLLVPVTARYLLSP